MITDTLILLTYNSIWTHQARRWNSCCWKYKTVKNKCRKSYTLQACLWNIWSNHCGDCEGCCFQEVDVKWTAIRAQALLHFMLPPSSWQPHSVICTDCKNLALVMEMLKWGGRILQKLTICHHASVLRRTLNTACYMYMYINML